MTDTELKIYNEASAATVAGNRTRLARALRFARRLHRNGCGYVEHTRLGRISLITAIVWHCNYIGWPIRLRPNGRYI